MKHLKLNIKLLAIIIILSCLFNFAMAQKKECESTLTLNWWNSLSYYWQKLLISTGGLTYPITSNELEKLKTLWALDMRDYPEINDLSPICALPQLLCLNCSKTKITSIEPIIKLIFLERFVCDSVAIIDISPLYEIKTLKFVRLIRTEVPGSEIQNFIKANSDVRVIWY